MNKNNYTKQYLVSIDSGVKCGITISYICSDADYTYPEIDRVSRTNLKPLAQFKHSEKSSNRKNAIEWLKTRKIKNIILLQERPFQKDGVTIKSIYDKLQKSFKQDKRLFKKHFKTICFDMDAYTWKNIISKHCFKSQIKNFGNHQLDAEKRQANVAVWLDIYNSLFSKQIEQKTNSDIRDSFLMACAFGLILKNVSCCGQYTIHLEFKRADDFIYQYTFKKNKIKTKKITL